MGIGQFIFQYWLQELLIIISASIGFIIKEIKKQRAKQISVEKGVQALLRNELLRCYKEFKTKGSLSIMDKENIEHMFQEYKNLGGNGTVEKLINELLELPTDLG